uniref:Secreted protein n=1 Tax=Streptomyces sp. NBC_00049 TaxID=2903617 RepID=A0AAU2JHQ5_9ACTN
MKFRHVRAIAVFGIALVALTGARGSHGASCGGSSHSSGSSSSSSGGSSTGGSNDSTSGSSGGTSVTGGSGSSANKAERDIKIDTCKLDDSGKNLVARLTVTNSGSLDYTYDITMKFRGDAASTAAPAQAKVTGLKVKAGASAQAEAKTPYTGKGDGSEYKECVVAGASKSSL